MSNRVRATLIALLSVLALIASTESAFAADVRHSGPYWSWTGPSNWTASYGTYGITITGPGNQDVLDLGFSSTVCAPGSTYAQSVSNYFAAKRRTYSQGIFHLDRASAITRPTGTDVNYRRQVLRVSWTSNKVAYTGDFSFDYDYQTTVSTGTSTVNYCYQRSLATYTPKSRYDASGRARLVKVFNSLAYSGPGACIGMNGNCDPDL